MEEREARLAGKPGPGKPSLIELGWLIAGRLSRLENEAVAAARERLGSYLEATFPGFAWELPAVERPELAPGNPEEPVNLLDHGIGERDVGRWDFALVVTGSDLVSYAKPYALAAPSRSVGVAVISTARLDPRGPDTIEADDVERRERLAQRIFALALHLFGHLNGLHHETGEGQAMGDIDAVEDLDGVRGYSPAAQRRLANELEDVADLRLEEAPRHRQRRGTVSFYLLAGWHNRDDITDAVRKARPWLFPLRLARLTTAAASALLVLLITGEAWDLGMSQTPGRVAGLALAILLATTVYILARQRLLVRRGGRRRTEQAVVTNISITLTVVGGLLTTYGGLFLLTLLLAWAAFPRRLVETWAASLEGPVGLAQYLILAAFTASLGILIGALGASFEEQSYIKNITYVDEET